MGQLHSTRQQGDKWGQLPAHERDRILQSLTEGFPPHYQNILEAYYKRLAEEKPKGDDAGAATPSGPATAKPDVKKKLNIKASPPTPQGEVKP